MRRHHNWLALILGISLIPLSFAGDDTGFHLYPHPDGLSQDEFNRALAFARELETRLPQSFKQRLGKDFVIRFDGPASDPNRDKDFFDSITDTVKGGPSESKVEQITLHLDRSLIPSGSTAASEEAVGSLIHQLSRKYDAPEEFNEKSQKDLDWCRHTWDATSKLQPGQPDCIRILSMSGRGSISERPQFQTLAGWNESGFIIKSRSQNNQYKDRSPDPEEFSSTHEAFAVNMEKFMTDPEFACRRPAVYRYLKGEFGESPVANLGACDGKITLPRSSQYSNLPPTPIKIDPKRVYEIQYMLADKGDDLASSRGHAMARIVVCGPERKTVGPECLQDENSHLVVSYRAFVNDPKIGYIDGLTGKYPSKMYVLPYREVVNQYNVDELRDLKMPPIKYNRDEIENFVSRIGERAWQYSGRYYALGNNCSDELWNDIKSAKSDRSLEKYTVNTPMGLYEALTQAKLLRDPAMKDRDKAMREGHFRQAEIVSYEKAFENIKNVVPALPYSDLPTMLDSTTPAERRKLWDEVKLRVRDPKQLVVAAGAFSMAEQFKLGKLRGQLMSGISDRLVDEPAKDEARKQKLMEGGLAMDTPAGLAILAKSRGYGIPTDCELASVGFGPQGPTGEQVKHLETVAKDVKKIIQDLADKELNTEFEAGVEQYKYYEKESERFSNEALPTLRRGV